MIAYKDPPGGVMYSPRHAWGSWGDLSVIDHPLFPSPLLSHLGVRCQEAWHGTGCGWDTRSDAASSDASLRIRIRSAFEITTSLRIPGDWEKQTPHNHHSFVHVAYPCERKPCLERHSSQSAHTLSYIASICMSTKTFYFSFSHKMHNTITQHKCDYVEGREVALNFASIKICSRLQDEQFWACCKTKRSHCQVDPLYERKQEFRRPLKTRWCDRNPQSLADYKKTVSREDVSNRDI